MKLRGRKKGDTDRKVLAFPSELRNPHRTRGPTFPQQRLRRRTNLPKRQTRQNRKRLQVLVQNRKRRMGTRGIDIQEVALEAILLQSQIKTETV